tara:strand:+ start:1576 stop:2133 length:558 start_codon:yes stop_codon:yes gene_type:complete
MATTTKEYTGDGSKGVAGAAQLTFSFPYLKTEDIKVSLNGTTLTTTKYTFPTADSIQFNALGSSPTTFETETQETNGAPKNNVKILFFRQTDMDTAKAVFASGSAFRARDLNNNVDQALFFAQEAADSNNPLISNSTSTNTNTSSFTVSDSAKVDGSIVYYDNASSAFKADATTTKTTIVDGGSY